MRTLKTDLAYLYGLLLGDGSISKDAVYYYTKNAKLAKRVVKLLKSLPKRKSDPEVKKNDIFVIKCKLEPELIEKMSKLPETDDPKVLCSFLKGVIESDGDIVRGYYLLVVYNMPLRYLELVKRAMEKLGISAKIVEYKQLTAFPQREPLKTKAYPFVVVADALETLNTLVKHGFTVTLYK